MSIRQHLNLAAKLTPDKEEQRNVWLSGIRSFFCNIHYSLPGNLRTNFVHQLGITPEMQAPYGIPSTFVVGPLATLFLTPYIDRIRNRIRAYAWLTVLSTIFGCLAPLIYCLGPKEFRSVNFVLVSGAVFGCWTAVVNVARNGLEGVITVRTLHGNIRGRFFSATGMIHGATGLAIGVFVTWAAKRFDARMALLMGASVSMAALLLGGWFSAMLRELPDLQDAPTAQPVQRRSAMEDLAKIFRMKEFMVMMPANLLRGLGNGVGAYIFWIALKRLELPPEYAGYLTIISTSAPFVGNWILWLTMDRFGAVVVIPASCTLIAASLMGTILTQSPAMFLFYNLVYHIMLPVEATAIPLAHYEVVPKEVMGAFSTIRLGLLLITGSVSATLAGLLMRVFQPVTIFAGSAAIKFIAGVLYCVGILALRKHAAQDGGRTPAAT